MPALASAIPIALIAEPSSIAMGTQLRKLHAAVLERHPLRRVALAADGDVRAADCDARVGVEAGHDDVLLAAEPLDGRVDIRVLAAAFHGVLVIGPGRDAGGEGQGGKQSGEAHGCR